MAFSSRMQFSTCYGEYSTVIDSEDDVLFMKEHNEIMTYQLPVNACLLVHC